MNDQTPSRWSQLVWVPADQVEDSGERFLRLAIDRNIVRAAIDTGETETAIRLALGNVDAEFAIEYGDLVAQLEAEIELIREHLAVERPALGYINRDLAHQPVMIPAPMTNGGAGGPGNPNAEVPPSKWQLRDKIGVAGAALGIVGLSTASYVVFQTTFEASGLPIFDDNPHLPMWLAVIAPTGGYAVKLIANVFTDPANRDRYRKVLAIGGGVALAVYIPLFGALFEGLSGVFDPFAEPNHLLGWAFNVSHVVCEILIAANLWGYAESIARTYSPSEEVENAAIPPRSRVKAERVQVVERLTERLGKATGKLAQLYGIRDSARNLVETAIRQKMAETPRDGLL